MAAFAAAMALWKRSRPSFSHVVLLAPIVVYVSMSMLSRIDIGLRHLLPIFPFVFALLGAALARWRPPYVVGVCVLLAVESFAVYPNYLAFFNAAVGGPAQGPRYLLDSNIDWGQDLIKLKSWMDSRGVKQVCVAYFGSADRGYYAIDGPPVPATRDGQKDADCYAAISVTLLYDAYARKGDYAWLRDRQPLTKVGYSIYVYDLRKLAQGDKGTPVATK